MAAKIIAVVAALCLVQVNARHARAAPAAPAEGNQLQELAHQAQTIVENLGAKFHETLGVKDNQEVVQLIQNNTASLASTMEDLFSQLKKEAGAHAGDLDNLINQVSQKVSATVADIQKQNPEVVAQANQLQAKFKDGMQTIVAETDKIVKAIGENAKGTGQGVQESITKLTKDVLDQAVATTNTVKAQYEEAVKSHEASHKH